VSIHIEHIERYENDNDEIDLVIDNTKGLPNIQENLSEDHIVDISFI